MRFSTAEAFLDMAGGKGRDVLQFDRLINLDTKTSTYIVLIEWDSTQDNRVRVIALSNKTRRPEEE